MSGIPITQEELEQFPGVDYVDCSAAPRFFKAGESIIALDAVQSISNGYVTLRDGTKFFLNPAHIRALKELLDIRDLG